MPVEILLLHVFMMCCLLPSMPSIYSKVVFGLLVCFTFYNIKKLKSAFKYQHSIIPHTHTHKHNTTQFMFNKDKSQKENTKNSSHALTLIPREEQAAGGGDHNYNAIFHSIAAELYSWQRQLYHNYNAIFHSSAAELYSWAKTIVCLQCMRRRMRRRNKRRLRIELQSSLP